MRRVRRAALLAAMAAAGPAFGWEFSPEPICTLRHATPEAEIVITFDATGPLYTLEITWSETDWRASPTFGMAFLGPRGLQIGTNRHVLDGRRLTVEDRGFGNVLDGLEFNRSAIAATTLDEVSFDLSEAAGPVRAFRACPAALPGTS